MAGFGKKILSAFVEVTEENESVTAKQEKQAYALPAVPAKQMQAGNTEKFNAYFDQLFSDANMPGPDYFEFTKMIQAMAALTDEKARYTAAFAGLSVQGLDKNKLLNTAEGYLKILETDAASFNSSVDAALHDKVQAKQQEIETKLQRIQQLEREISDLQNQVKLLEGEVRENEAKIESNTGGYRIASENMKQQIRSDIGKIQLYIA